MQRTDFTTQIDRHGYMIFFKGTAIGGAGTKRSRYMHWQHARQNIKDYKDHAESDIQRLIEKGTVEGYR